MELAGKQGYSKDSTEGLPWSLLVSRATARIVQRDCHGACW